MAVLRRAEVDDAWVQNMCGPVATQLLDLGLAGLTLHLRDAPVRDSLMTLTTLDPPAQGVVTLWAHQHYGDQVEAALGVLDSAAEHLSAYLVTESEPMPPPPSAPGQRAPGLANIALLRRPADLDEAAWLRRWQHDHTPVAIATQSTFGYVQNYVVRALTEHAPDLAAIVEELFPIEAVSSLHAFFGAADDHDLTERMNAMIASTSAFGANVNVDTVPTGRYVFRSPFPPVG